MGASRCPSRTSMRVVQNAPSGAAATGWLVTLANEYPGFTISAYVWVLCANVA